MRADPAMMGSGLPRLPGDSYFTRDPMCVDGLAKHFNLRDLRILEPCAGEGHMIWHLERHGAKVVIAADLHAHPGQDIRILPGIDYLTRTLAPDTCVEAIVTNPPFSTIAAFIRHSLRILPNGWVIMLARHEWMTASGRLDQRQELLKDPRFYAYCPIIGRPSWHTTVTAKARHPCGWLLWAGNGDHDGPYLWL